MGDRENLPAIYQPDQGVEVLSGEVVDFDPIAFLEERGIESLADRKVTYEGESLPLHEALVICGHARKAIDAAVGMARTTGEKNVLPMMDGYLNQMEEQAASSNGAAEDAKKKVS
jgi:hypothetical protein